MKVYLFNAENGVFEGEAYVDPDPLEYAEGITTVVPPEYAHGQVPVFDRERKTWEVISLGVARQLLNLSQQKTQEKPL